ncbi:unnamed protein product [Malus baccata var. baccata]
MDQKRYLVLSHMMIYALNNLHTDSIVMNQTTGSLNRNIENLLQERLEDKQKISSMNTEMIQLQLKNTAASMKVNKLLDEIGSLKKKLLENQAIVPDLNDSTKEDPEEDEPPKADPDNDDQVEEHTHDKDTATEDPVQENATENDVAMEDQEHEGKDNATEKRNLRRKETAKKKTRTLVKNIRRRDDRKPNANPHYDYIPIQRKQRKAKYIFAVSDSESPSIFPSESQPLEPIIDKGKKEPKVESPLNTITNKPAKKAAKKPVKQNLDKRYHLPASTRAYKLLDDETKEKFKEYYRQEKMGYFWMQPRQGSMVTDLVVLKSDLTSLFNDMEIEKSKSDKEHIDKTLQTLLQDNVDKVGKVFILIKHYFHFSLVVWDIKNGKMKHYNSKLPRMLNLRPTKGGLVMQEGKPIEATFEKEEVFAKRAQIATTLVNHKNSYANGLKKILEDRRQQNKHGQYNDIPDEDFITLA